MPLRGFKYIIALTAITAIYSNYFGLTIIYFILKLLTTSLIILMPLLYASVKNSLFAKSIIIGLIFCLIGDFSLLFEHYFTIGLISFLVGHIFFIRSFTVVNGWHWPLKIGIPLTFIAGILLCLIYSNLNSFFTPILIYIIVIVIMSWQGIFLQLSSSNEVFKSVGYAVSLFMFSDGILALNKFYIHFSSAGILILSTYWLAIFFLGEAASK
ncbi:lysoplasmalogenase [Flavobacteriaceae bacterium]|jgi:uncharacterized membrane protein YhhN|nr:lysoplasmalogenase [Flavobacteriaceae bacterium]MDB4062577.1 lysoplasmalogenase [Flavobacteriaceae bacterium]